MTPYGIFKKADLPLDVMMLLIAAMMLLIPGVLLFPVSEGALPYDENGLFGLLLVAFSMQMIMMGKTPFGDVRRSNRSLAVGVAIAAAGMTTCFVPAVLGPLPRVLLVLCFGPGGLALLLQMCFDKGKLRSWMTYGGIFRHLIFGCGAAYGLSMAIGLLIWKPSLLTPSLEATIVLMYGAAIAYLAGVLWKIHHMHPEDNIARGGGVGLSADMAMILLMAVFMLLLGGLLIPVNFGLFPFSASAQLGLLMVMFAVQMLASGNTPIGPFSRSWLMVLIGLLVAALGIISCMIPGILVAPLTVLVGVLNILGGVISGGKTAISRARQSGELHGPATPVRKKLLAAQLTMSLLTIMFGISMLVSRLIPGLVIGVILAVSGCVLLYLLHILTVLEKFRYFQRG